MRISVVLLACSLLFIFAGVEAGVVCNGCTNHEDGPCPAHCNSCNTRDRSCFCLEGSSLCHNHYCPSGYNKFDAYKSCWACCMTEGCRKSENKNTGRCNRCANGRQIVGIANSKHECRLCSPGKYSTNGKTCTNCPSGKYIGSQGATTCTRCDIGRYASNTGFSVCAQCPKGKFQNGYQKTVCMNCAAGAYAPTKGLTVCDFCEAGTYSVAAKSTCYNCAAGSFSFGGSTTCTLCEKGTYAKYSRSPVCNACTGGKYRDTKGATSCRKCNRGKYSAEGASAANQCVNPPCISNCASLATVGYSDRIRDENCELLTTYPESVSQFNPRCKNNFPAWQDGCNIKCNSDWYDEPPAGSAVTDLPTTATFVDNLGREKPNRPAIKVDANTFVFGYKYSDWYKMCAVDALGTKIGCRYFAANLYVNDQSVKNLWSTATVNNNAYGVRNVVLGSQFDITNHQGVNPPLTKAPTVYTGPPPTPLPTPRADGTSCPDDDHSYECISKICRRTTKTGGHKCCLGQFECEPFMGDACVTGVSYCEDFDLGCWADETTCDMEVSCDRMCCNTATLWHVDGETTGVYEQAKCGTQPCTAKGEACEAEGTCELCCEAATWWKNVAPEGYKCGSQPCWSDGDDCLLGTTCSNCCNTESWWNGGGIMGFKCGTEPCWGDGATCGAGTTCNSCCNSYEYWYKSAWTKCGQEPRTADGVLCDISTTCEVCRNPWTWWWGKAMTACGQFPQWADGTTCLADTTCKACLNPYTFWLGSALDKCGQET